MAVTISTRTRVDTGGWFGKRRLHAAMEPDGLVLSAKGADSFEERIPLSELRESIYNHTTGELVLAPAEQTKIKSLKVTPLESAQILKHINKT